MGKSLHFDHCHKTTIFRGFLCQQCNVALGLARESIQVLQGLIEYLKEFEERPSGEEMLAAATGVSVEWWRMTLPAICTPGINPGEHHA